MLAQRSICYAINGWNLTIMSVAKKRSATEAFSRSRDQPHCMFILRAARFQFSDQFKAVQLHYQNTLYLVSCNYLAILRPIDPFLSIWFPW